MTTIGMILFLTIVVAWLTAAATSVRSVSRIWLRHWAEQRLTGSEGQVPALDRPQRLLLAAGTGIAGTVFAMGALVGLREEGDVLLRYLALASVALLIAGQLVPRAVARRWAPALVPVLVPALRLLEWACAPLLKFAAELARRASRRLPSAPDLDGRDALEDLLREGELEGVGEASESAIISGVVEFGAKEVAQVMTSREDIVAAERTLSPSAVTRLAAHSKYSRIPVYERDLDHVVGLVHSFDILADPESPVANLRTVAFTAPSTPCHALMRRMLRERVHLAIVQGPDAGTLGLVTLEDLVEELVGDISDEHDDPGPDKT